MTMHYSLTSTSSKNTRRMQKAPSVVTDTHDHEETSDGTSQSSTVNKVPNATSPGAVEAGADEYHCASPKPSCASLASPPYFDPGDDLPSAGLKSVFEDSETESDITLEESEGAQYITIPFTSPFYHPPSSPWTSVRPDSATLSFACDALSPGIASPAEEFHDVIQRPMSSSGRGAFLADKELVLQPNLELHSLADDSRYRTTRESRSLPRPLTSPFGRPSSTASPDVPLDLDEEGDSD